MLEVNSQSGASGAEVFIVVCDDVFIAQDAAEILGGIGDVNRVLQVRSTEEAHREIALTEGRAVVVMLLPRHPLQGVPLFDMLARKDGVLIVLSEKVHTEASLGCRVIHGQVPFTSSSLASLVARV